MLVNFGLLPRENFSYRKKRTEAYSKDSAEEDVSRLVFDDLQDNTLASSALHYTPFYCSRDYVYQEMGYSSIHRKVFQLFDWSLQS